MIRRRQQHEAFGIALFHAPGRSDGCAGGGVAAEGFEDEQGLGVEAVELAADLIRMGGVGYDRGRPEQAVRARRQPVHGRLDQAPFADKLAQLLGMRGPRRRPQPRARTA